MAASIEAIPAGDLLPVQVEFGAGTPDASMLQSVVLLLHHVLPRLSRRFIKRAITAPGVVTVCMFLQPGKGTGAGGAAGGASGAAVSGVVVDETGQPIGRSAVLADTDVKLEVLEEDTSQEDDIADNSSDDSGDDDSSDDDANEEGDIAIDTAATEADKIAAKAAQITAVVSRDASLLGVACYTATNTASPSSQLVMPLPAVHSFELDLQSLSVVQLLLIGVRPSSQRRRVGTRLLSHVQAASRSHRAPLICYADPVSAPFFRAQGMSDDLVLNTRFRRLPNFFARAILFSVPQLPAAPDFSSSNHDDAGFLRGDDVSVRIAAWQRAQTAVYSEQLVLLSAMQAEIARLRQVTDVHKARADRAVAAAARAEQELVLVSHERDMYKRRLHAMLEAAAESSIESLSSASAPAATLIGAEYRLPSASVPIGRSVSNLGSIAALVMEQVHPSHGLGAVTVVGAVDVTPAGKLEQLSKAIQLEANTFGSATPATFFIGADADSLAWYAGSGFTTTSGRLVLPPDPLQLNVYGQGLYVSRYASRAFHYSRGSLPVPHHAESDRPTTTEDSVRIRVIMMVQAVLGRVHAVTKEQPAATEPPSGYHSLVTPGRRLPTSTALPKPMGAADASAPTHVDQEYVIFSASQIVATHLLWLHSFGEE